MRIWSILLIKSESKWCKHLRRSLFLNFNEHYDPRTTNSKLQFLNKYGRNNTFWQTYIILSVSFFRFWDIFQIITRENAEKDVHKHISLRIIKIITYVLLFVIFLASLVTQKVSLVTLATGLYTNATSSDADISMVNMYILLPLQTVLEVIYTEQKKKGILNLVLNYAFFL